MNNRGLSPNTRDTLTAMGAARNAATNNRLATQQEKDRIRQLAGGDSEKERRLTAASCALIRCSAQFAEGSEAWRIGRALEIEGARPGYAADRALLQGQAGMFGYTTTGLFSDKNIDAAKRVDDTYKISTRAGGALQAIGGVATGVAGVGMVAAGGATCLETGVGCVVAAGGTALTGWSADQTRAGWNTLSTGQHQQTLGGAWVSSTFGVSPNTGELIYGLAGLSPAAVEAVGLNRVANGYAAGNAASRASYGAKGAAAVDEVGGGVGASTALPGSATFEGPLYRAVGDGHDPLLIHPGNIAANHRYTGPGQGGLYFATGQHVVEAEFVNNGASLAGKQMHTFPNSKASDLLDLSNPATRETLGIDLGDITRRGGTQAWRYEVTQPLGSWAQQNGYKGIIAPSAQADGGVNVILFNPRSLK